MGVFKKKQQSMTSKEYNELQKEKMTEHQEQVIVNNHCTKNNILMFAIPNGAFRHKKTARDLKAEGVKSGVPDMFFPIPNKFYNGLFIELKKRPKTLMNGKKSFSGIVTSDNQKIWMQELEHRNYKAVVCYGSDEAIEVIDNYLKDI